MENKVTITVEGGYKYNLKDGERIIILNENYAKMLEIDYLGNSIESEETNIETTSIKRSDYEYNKKLDKQEEDAKRNGTI